MAERLKEKLRSFLRTPAGVVVEVLVYAVLLLLILTFFTGNGQFIYEAF
jgi:hypothetical protein